MQHSPTTTPDRRWRAALAALTILAGLVAIPIAATTPAAAVGTRTVSQTLRCSPTGITAGMTTTCTVVITDTNSGSKNTPEGTVVFSVDSGTMKVITPCILTTVSNSRASCTTAKLLFQSARTFELTATYAASDDHTNKVTTEDYEVNSSSQVGVYSPNSLSTGIPGDQLQLFGSGCVGSTKRVGIFVAKDLDPQTSNSGAVLGWQASASSAGSFDWSPALEADHPLGVFKARFFCATSSVTSISSGAIQSLTPVLTMTVSAPAQAMRAARLSTTSDPSSTGSADAPIVTITRDPNAVPGIDTVEIPGTQMALLKSRVDATAQISDRVTRLAMAFRDRIPERSAVDLWTSRLAAGTSDATYAASLATSVEYQLNYAPLLNGPFVDRAHQKLLGRTPTAAERTSLVAALTNRTTTRPAMLVSIASSPEHLARTATRSYVLATYQALTPVMPGDALLARFTRQLDDQVFRIQMIEDLALSRAPAATWLAALATAPSTAKF